MSLLCTKTQMVLKSPGLVEASGRYVQYNPGVTEVNGNFSLTFIVARISLTVFFSGGIELRSYFQNQIFNFQDFWDVPSGHFQFLYYRERLIVKF